MKRGLLIISLGLNLGLAAAALHFCQRPPALPAPRISQSAAMRENIASIPEVSQLPPDSELLASYITNRFHWRMLESKDYERYVANLRAVGCPENTVRDIVIADVEKLYAAKMSAVPLQSGFWSTGANREAATIAQEQQQRALENEKQAVLQRLIGVDCQTLPEKPDDLIALAIVRFVLGPLPEGVPEKVRGIMEKGEAVERDISSRAGGIMLPQDEKQSRMARAQMIADLKVAMSLEQFEEFAARSLAMGLMDHGLEYFQTSAAELRQIAHVYAAICGIGDEEKPIDLFSKRGLTSAQEQEVASRLTACLGEKRFAEFQRVQDPDFRSAADLSRQHNLPAGTPDKIVEIKQLAQTERLAVQADASVTVGVRAEQLQQIRDTTQAAVQRLLGEEAYEAYLKQGNGRWVTNSLAYENE